jgi:hypothetical protein
MTESATVSVEWLRKRMDGYFDATEIIYCISPSETPFMSKLWDSPKIKKRRTGASMRQRRRSIMKPIKFTPKHSARKYHEWKIDA